MRKTFAAFVTMMVALCSVAAAGSAQPKGTRIEDLAGIYDFHHRIDIYNGPTDTEASQVDDILEIVKVSEKNAYIRIHLLFDNGHVCSLYGIGMLEGGALVYRTPVYDAIRKQQRTCEFSLSRDADKLHVADPDNVCRIDSCGARGSFDGVEFGMKTRRTIRYMPLILNSREYQDAMKNFAGAAGSDAGR